MAQNQATVDCNKDSWTLLSNAAVTNISFANISKDAILYIAYTATDVTPPTGRRGAAYPFPLGEANVAIADRTALGSADTVWGRTESLPATVWVDHA